MLIDSYIRRMRWQQRESAAAHFSVYAEMMGRQRPQQSGAPVDAKTGIPINTTPMPIAAMLKIGMGM